MASAAAGVLRVFRKPLASGKFRPALWIDAVVKRWNVRRRWWWRESEQDFEYPLASKDGRGSFRERSRDLHAGLPSDPTSFGGEYHATEGVTLHIWDAVVPRKPGVNEAVVRGEEIGHIAVLPDDAAEEFLRLTSHRSGKVAGEGGEKPWVWLCFIEIAEAEPLCRESSGERAGTFVLEHAPHVRTERSAVTHGTQ